MDVEVKKVKVFNLLGQVIKSWDVRNSSSHSNELRIPYKNNSEGYYIVKVETASGIITKKFIIKN
jgi:hypothetical protein